MQHSLPEVDVEGRSRGELLEMAFGCTSPSPSPLGSDSEVAADEGAEQEDSAGCQGAAEPHIAKTLHHRHVRGLHQVKGWLSGADQGAVLHFAEHAGWLVDPGKHNQAMVFGQLPGWLTPLLARLAAEASALWPPALAARQPLFNQLIVNLYQPGQGITPHVDLARFQDGIANISLMSTCIMRFRDAPAPGDTHDSAQGEEHQVLLEPGDLLLLHGDARYSYTHGIDACHQEIWGGDGRRIERCLRMSLTLRALVEEAPGT
eukprot:jgi/Tetstr1/457200/TSEL_043848.t1